MLTISHYVFWVVLAYTSLFLYLFINGKPACCLLHTERGTFDVATERRFYRTHTLRKYPGYESQEASPRHPNDPLSTHTRLVKRNDCVYVQLRTKNSNQQSYTLWGWKRWSYLEKLVTYFKVVLLSSLRYPTVLIWNNKSLSSGKQNGLSVAIFTNKCNASVSNVVYNEWNKLRNTRYRNAEQW